MQSDRCIGDAKFFRHDITFKETAFVAAIFFRPGHTDPSLGADTFAERAIVRVAVAGPVRIERADGDFLRKQSPHIAAQALAFWRKADLIEVQVGAHRDATNGQNSSAPCLAIRLPSSAAQKLSLPKSSRHASRRNVKRCRMCSSVKPIAPKT